MWKEWHTRESIIPRQPCDIQCCQPIGQPRVVIFQGLKALQHLHLLQFEVLQNHLPFGLSIGTLILSARQGMH